MTYLKKNPETSTKGSNGPCQKPKDDEPNDCEEGILGHGELFCLETMSRKKMTRKFVMMNG